MKKATAFQISQQI